MRFTKAVQLSLCALALCIFFGASANADDWSKKTVVTFADAVEIPGQVLPAGTYVFKLLDSPANRNIVRIWNANESQLLATVQTIPDYRIDPSGQPTFDFDERPGNGPMALHSWFFPGDRIGQEFIYSY